MTVTLTLTLTRPPTLTATLSADRVAHRIAGRSHYGPQVLPLPLTLPLTPYPNQDVSITDLKFGTEFAKAIESKQVMQQEAERSKFIVVKAEQEKQANIIRAEGEAQVRGLTPPPSSIPFPIPTSTTLHLPLAVSHSRP